MRACGLGTAGLYDIQRLAIRWDGYVRRIHHPRQALEPRVLFAGFAEGRMAGYIAGHFSERYVSQHHKTEGELQSI